MFVHNIKMLLRTDVAFEALFICDIPYHISEYEDEGEFEHCRDHGCRMERSRLLNNEQRSL